MPGTPAVGVTSAPVAKVPRLAPVGSKTSAVPWPRQKIVSVDGSRMSTRMRMTEFPSASVEL